MNLPRRFLWSYPLLGVLGLWGVVALWDTGTRSDGGFVVAVVVAVGVGLGLGMNAARPVDPAADAPPLGVGLAVGVAILPVALAVRNGANADLPTDVILWVLAIAGVAAGAGFCCGLTAGAIVKRRSSER